LSPKRKSKDWLKGLTQTPPPPSLELNQEVKVVRGKNRGKKGRVIFYRTEGDGGRLTLSLDNGQIIYVDKDDIDFQFDCISIVVMMDDEERAAFQQRVKEIKEGYS